MTICVFSLNIELISRCGGMDKVMTKSEQNNDIQNTTPQKKKDRATAGEFGYRFNKLVTWYTG